MPVSGKELATLDFANLIGGPLNAVVEAQAKSGLATVNFIKETSFDKDGNLINVDFKYSREGGDFSLTVPFLTLLPVPYITISEAEIEFNAKITSINESKADDDLTTGGELEASTWWSSAKLQSKTSYQRKTTATEREERTFDMHVRVLAGNQEIPAGTERLLTILEGSIAEKKGRILDIGLTIQNYDGDKTLTLDGPDKTAVEANAILEIAGKEIGKAESADQGKIVLSDKIKLAELSLDKEQLKGKSVMVKNPKTPSPPKTPSTINPKNPTLKEQTIEVNISGKEGTNAVTTTALAEAIPEGSKLIIEGMEYTVSLAAIKDAVQITTKEALPTTIAAGKYSVRIKS